MNTLTGRELEIQVVNRAGAKIVVCPDAQVTSVSEVLNNYGKMDFTIGTNSQGADEARKLHENEIQLWVDDQLYWWGVPMAEGGGPGEMNIGCDGLFSYFEDRMIDDQSLEWTSTEQFFIARDLVQYAQSEAVQANRDYNIGVTIGALSGKVRTQRYVRAEHQFIGELLREFPTLEDGFDFDIVFAGDGSRNWVPYYPRRGVTHNGSEAIMLEWGKNITTYGYSRSALEMRTQTYATGGSVPNSEEGRMEQTFEDVAASAKYGVIQATLSDGSQMDPVWLLEKATEDVAKNNAPIGVPEITGISLEDSDLLLDLNVGDYVQVRIDDGARQVAEYFRIGTKTWDPVADTIDLGFIEEGLPA